MRAKLSLALLTFALAATAASLAEAREVRVALDEAEAIHLAAPARGVVIGNPAIASVTVQDDHLLFVTGRSYGATNLIVVGDDGRTLVRTRVRVVPEESAAVILTRGAETVRLDCTPECRRRPDISDSATAFSEAVGQIGAREGQ